MLSKKNHGFSLVELSIVLVIVSLLATAVMGGTKLVRTARLSTVIKEVTGIKAAVDAFTTKYSSLPGDFDGAGGLWSDCTSGNGNGNGQINHTPEFEGGLAFAHMYYADILTQAPVRATDARDIPNQFCAHGHYLPSLARSIVYAIDGLDRVSGQTVPAAAFGTTDLRKAFIITMGIDTAGAVEWNENALSPKDSFFIDRKIDDGVYNNGHIAGHEGDATVGCISGGQYNLSATGEICVLAIRFR